MTDQDPFKRSIISGWGDIFSVMFGGGSSGGYNKVTINKIKKTHTCFAGTSEFTESKNPGWVFLLTLIRVKIKDQRKLLYILDSAPNYIQHTYADRFTYLEISAINRHQCQVILHKNRNYPCSNEYRQNPHLFGKFSFSYHLPIVYFPVHTQRSVKNIKEWMIQQLIWLYQQSKNIWSYYKLLWVGPIVCKDHLVVILQVPSVNKSVVMNIHRTINLSILHPVFQIVFQYSLVGE